MCFFNTLTVTPFITISTLSISKSTCCKISAFCLIVIVTSSCSQNRFVHYNRKDLTGSGIRITNDSLNFSINYFADYKFVKRPTRKKLRPFHDPGLGTQVHRSLLKSINPSTTLFLCGTQDPYFASGAWVISPENVVHLLADSIKSHRDLNDGNFLPGFSAPSSDKETMYLSRIYLFNGQYVLFAACSNLKQQSKTIQYEALKDLMTLEYKQIFDSISKSD